MPSAYATLAEAPGSMRPAHRRRDFGCVTTTRGRVWLLSTLNDGYGDRLRDAVPADRADEHAERPPRARHGTPPWRRRSGTRRRAARGRTTERASWLRRQAARYTC